MLRTGGLRDPGRRHIHLMDQVLHVIVGLRNPGGAESIGLDDVRAGGQVLFVDLLDHLWLRQNQQLVVALDVVREIPETVAPISRLVQLVALDHRAHRAVEDQNALPESRFELGYAFLVHGCVPGRKP